MPLLNCIKCQKSFYAKPFNIKKGFGKYCSRTCHHLSMKKGKEETCSVCSKKIYKTEQSLKRSKSRKFFCNKSCQAIWRNKEYSGENHKLWKGGITLYRTILEKTGKPVACELCKESDKRVLAVHHIDENHFNNEVKNLAWLCFNCHHLVHHDMVEKQKFLHG